MLLSAGAGQGLHQHGVGVRVRRSSRKRSPVRRPMRRGGHRRQAGARRSVEVFVHGGRNPTGRDAVAMGAGDRSPRRRSEILLTSMDADRTKAGYDTDLLAAVSRAGACR